MYSTTAYLYQQITRVLLVDTSGGYFTARYDPVYAKTLTVNKGVDNVLLFEFINQDQKPVNIAGSTFVFRLMNQTGDRMFVEKEMVILSAATGRVKVVLDTADTIDIVAQPGSYSIQRSAGNYVQAVFVDADAGARADCNIVDSILPDFVPSKELTIPNVTGYQTWQQPAPQNWPDWALQPAPMNRTQMTEYYSSEMPTNGLAFTTIKFELVHFTGTLKVQGAQDYLAVWTDVTESRQYYDATKSDYWTVVGFHPLLRLALNQSIGSGASANATVSNGVVTSISVQNQGEGFQAPPYIQILGDGAGATAVSQVNAGGQVTGVTVTNGGSGYVPIQYQGSISATVVVSNGLCVNLMYR